MIPQFKIYSRSYCHLCDDMLEALQAWAQKKWPNSMIEVAMIDVDAQPHLEQSWGEKVPVLFVNDHYVCHYFFDADKLIELID